MHCPHCSERISHFSKALNKFGRKRFCPHCGKPIKLSTNGLLLSILIVPFIALSYLAKPYFIAYGLSGGWSTGLAVGLLILITLKIVPGDV